MGSKEAAGERRRHRHLFGVEVGDLRRQPGKVKAVQLAAPLADLAVSGAGIPDDEPVIVEARLESVHEGIFVTGTVRARWAGECRRCLKPAAGALVAEVRELCVEDGDEETTYPLRGDELDLEPIVHDACILELPLAPLCGEGCLGLCPECGADRNLEPCSCVPAPDPRWAGLSVLTGGRAENAGGMPDPRQGADGSP